MPRARATPQDPLGRMLSRAVARERTPGASWWVGASDGRPASRGAVGRVAAGSAAAAVEESTPFDLASLTKPLATAPLLALCEQRGTLELDSPLGSALGEARTSAWSDCSLLSLAAHTSGLPAWEALFLRATTLEGYLERILGLPPALPRGRTLYSDLGYVLLGAVLQRATGRPLDALFDEQIAEPLGLKRVGFAGARGRFADAAHAEHGNLYERRLAGRAGDGHAWRREIPAGEVHDANAHGLGGVAGHAGLFGTAGEVARLAAALIRPGALGLDARARGRLLRVVPGSEGRTVGFVTAAASRAARGILPAGAPGHTGFTGTSLWLDPPGERVFVLLTNRVHPRVPERDFQPLRRAFHRLALRAV